MCSICKSRSSALCLVVLACIMSTSPAEGMRSLMYFYMTDDI